ncbi:MAG TPA: hypothetical protein VFE32_20560 [Puia sp.]|jgi:hypothetical protein|nr:hypothetical protein [Puia sp.]
MELKSGIAVHNQLPEGYESVRINSGVVFHSDQVADNVNYQGLSYRPQYEDAAYVARRDWRRLTAGEIRALRANGKRNDFNTVYAGDIPDTLKEAFSQMGLAESASRDEVFSKFQGSAEKTRSLSGEIGRFLEPMADGREFKFHCIGINFPNIEMVGCNTTKLPAGFKPPEVKYMGMHNDGTAKMTVRTAHRFGNRISINLGKDARSFLFVNLSMIQVLNMLKREAGIEEKDINIGNISGLFFRHFPGYPVIRIIQKPYQYYIAPTDNCFHDGSTLGNTELDITIVYFGFFKC